MQAHTVETSWNRETFPCVFVNFCRLIFLLRIYTRHHKRRAAPTSKRRFWCPFTSTLRSEDSWYGNQDVQETEWEAWCSLAPGCTWTGQNVSRGEALTYFRCCANWTKDRSWPSNTALTMVHQWFTKFTMAYYKTWHYVGGKIQYSLLYVLLLESIYVYDCLCIFFQFLDTLQTKRAATICANIKNHVYRLD